jgi:hypothetical protein
MLDNNDTDLDISNNVIILMLRGHIRNSFDNNNLYNLIKCLSDNYKLVIYIHTWKIQQNNISWRKMENIDKLITQDIIFEYFNDLKYLIKHIIIDDDNDITLIGNLKGRISGIPTIGWKRYWYGKYKIIDYINSNENDKNIINMRFDVLKNSNNFTAQSITNFIDNNIYKNITNNIFLNNDTACCGCDNIYIGNINTMFYLIKHFYYNLDEILIKYPYIINPEKLVFFENTIFPFCDFIK